MRPIQSETPSITTTSSSSREAEKIRFLEERARRRKGKDIKKKSVLDIRLANNGSSKISGEDVVDDVLVLTPPTPPMRGEEEARVATAAGFVSSSSRHPTTTTTTTTTSSSPSAARTSLPDGPGGVLVDEVKAKAKTGELSRGDPAPSQENYSWNSCGPPPNHHHHHHYSHHLSPLSASTARAAAARGFGSGEGEAADRRTRREGEEGEVEEEGKNIVKKKDRPEKLELKEVKDNSRQPQYQGPTGFPWGTPKTPPAEHIKSPTARAVEEEDKERNDIKAYNKSPTKEQRPPVRADNKAGPSKSNNNNANKKRSRVVKVVLRKDSTSALSPSPSKEEDQSLLDLIRDIDLGVGEELLKVPESAPPPPPPTTTPYTTTSSPSSSSVQDDLKKGRPSPKREKR